MYNLEDIPRSYFIGVITFLIITFLLQVLFSSVKIDRLRCEKEEFEEKLQKEIKKQLRVEYTQEILLNTQDNLRVTVSWTQNSYSDRLRLLWKINVIRSELTMSHYGSAHFDEKRLHRELAEEGITNFKNQLKTQYTTITDKVGLRF